MRSVEKLTGNWFLKRTFLNAYTVMVEVKYHFIDEECDVSPEMVMVRKAKESEMWMLGIKLK